MKMMPDNYKSFQFYRRWFLAAAIYNLIWGVLVILFPAGYFYLIGMKPPEYLVFWQVVGMCILVYAPGYWWASYDPVRYRHYIILGLLGKILGPIGFCFSVYQETLPLKFGLTIIANDLIWWPVFISFLAKMAKAHGGWGILLMGRVQ